MPTTTSFQNLLEAMPDALVGVDQAGIIRLLNRRAESLFGYESGQLIGRRIDSLVPESLLSADPAHLASFGVDPVNRRLGAGLTLSGRRGDGTRFPVDISRSALQTEDGLLVITAVRDVTEQTQAFEAARRLAAIVENSDDAIIGKTLDGVISSWNPAAERIYGYTSKEIVGKLSDVLTPPERASEIADLLAQVTAGQAVEHFRTLRVRKGGEVFPASLAMSPIRDGAGAIVGASTITRDVTEQVQAETALAEAGRQYRLLAENASDLVVLASPDRLITWVSPSVSRNLGWSTEDLIGTHLVNLIHLDDVASIEVLRDEVYSGREITQPAGGSLLRIRTKAGQYRWMSGTATAITDESGVPAGVVSGLRDVDELVRTREAATAGEAALRATLDSLMDPYVLLEAVRDEAGQITDFVYLDANPAACAYNRIDYQDLVGAQLLDLQPGSGGQGLLGQYRQVVETGEPLVLDDTAYALEFLNGQERRYDVRATRVGDGLSYTWRDVTDRHATAKWLVESEEQYRLLAENASDVVMSLSPEHMFKWVSGSIADVLGWPAPALVGHLIEEFVYPEDLPSFRQMVAEADPDSTGLAEFRFRRSDHTYRWVACRTRAKVDQDGTLSAVVGSLVDIQNRKAAEAQELTRLAELEQFHRLTIGREIKMIELKKEIEHLRHGVPDEGSDPGPAED